MEERLHKNADKAKEAAKKQEDKAKETEKKPETAASHQMALMNKMQKMMTKFQGKFKKFEGQKAKFAKFASMQSRAQAKMAKKMKQNSAQFLTMMNKNHVFDKVMDEQDKHKQLQESLVQAARAAKISHAKTLKTEALSAAAKQAKKDNA